MADQMRADALGIVNGWTRTPNIDSLAKAGTLLTGVVSNSAECIPARISMATGLYPHQTGVWENSTQTLNPNFPNWMQGVESAGYRTSLFGKTHLHPHEGDLRDRLHLMHAYGLQVVDETTGPHASAHVRSNMTASWGEQGLLEKFRADLAERRANKPFVARPSVLGLEHHYDVYVGQSALTHLKSLERDAPWFCWVSFGGPHEPWDAPEPYASLYADTPLPEPAPRLADHQRVRGLLRRGFDSAYYSPELRPQDVRELRANYAGNVTLIDDQIGAILNLLRDRNEIDDTLIVFTSDHGEMNGDQGLIYKANFLDPAIQVPVIVCPPAGSWASDRGSRLEIVGEWMDVGATILDYAGGTPAAESCARSFRPLLEGRSREHRALAVCEFLGHTAVVDRQWKAEFDPDLRPTLLFDRTKDPQEQRNLVDQPGVSSVLDGLKKRLLDFLSRTPPPATKATLD